MVGAGGVGKSAITARLVTGSFVETTMTIGLDIDSWSLIDKESGTTITTSMFDMGGQEHFRFFQEQLLLGAKVVLLVFDLTRFGTLFELDDWISSIENIPRDCWILVGNKTEIGVIAEDAVRDKAAEYGEIPYCIVSAKTGEGFEVLVELIHSKIK